MRTALIALALTASLHVSAETVPSLASVPVTLAADQSVRLGATIYFEVKTPKAPQLQKHLGDYQGVTVEQLDTNTLAVAMVSQPRYTGGLKQQYSRPSFVIDTDEAATRSFIAGFDASQQLGGELNAITAYVSEYISEPTYIHGFNLASTVAAQRSGDCTEYATLTTALARGLELNARLVLGTVIVDDAETVSAFGHAWTEVWYKGKWQIIDAALYGAGQQKFYYLPAGTLDNEGPGFAMALIRTSSLFPNQVENLRSLQ